MRGLALAKGATTPPFSCTLSSHARWRLCVARIHTLLTFLTLVKDASMQKMWQRTASGRLSILRRKRE